MTAEYLLDKWEFMSEILNDLIKFAKVTDKSGSVILLRNNGGKGPLAN